MVRADDITQEQWESCNPVNKRWVGEFLENSPQLSPKTLKQYTSALKIFFYWIKVNCGDKDVTQIKSRDYLLYQNGLARRGVSDSGMKMKRSAISSLNEYIMLYYQDDYPFFRNFITKQIKVPTTGFVHKKEPLDPTEYNMLCEKLEELEEWQKVAYLKFSYSTGCRRAEAMQLLKEVVTYAPIVKSMKSKTPDGEEIDVESRSYKTHDIRCKGKGSIGFVRKLQFSEEAMIAIKKWIETRGEDSCPYVFVTRQGSEYGQVSDSTFNLWCNTLFSEIIGRRVHPHLFRESRATNLVVHEGKDIKVAQKLLSHKSQETTLIYIIREDEDDADDAFI